MYANGAKGSNVDSATHTAKIDVSNYRINVLASSKYDCALGMVCNNQYRHNSTLVLYTLVHLKSELVLGIYTPLNHLNILKQTENFDTTFNRSSLAIPAVGMGSLRHLGDVLNGEQFEIRMGAEVSLKVADRALLVEQGIVYTSDLVEMVVAYRGL